MIILMNAATAIEQINVALGICHEPSNRAVLPWKEEIECVPNILAGSGGRLCVFVGKPAVVSFQSDKFQTGFTKAVRSVSKTGDRDSG